MLMMAIERFVKRDWSGAWSRARAKSDIKQEVLAELMGIPQNRVADQLNEHRPDHLSAHRLLELLFDPDSQRFLRYFMLEAAREAGVNLDALFGVTQIELVAERLIEKQQKRMARAELHAVKKERVA